MLREQREVDRVGRSPPHVATRLIREFLIFVFRSLDAVVVGSHAEDRMVEEHFPRHPPSIEAQESGVALGARGFNRIHPLEKTRRREQQHAQDAKDKARRNDELPSPGRYDENEHRQQGQPDEAASGVGRDDSREHENHDRAQAELPDHRRGFEKQEDRDA